MGKPCLERQHWCQLWQVIGQAVDGLKNAVRHELVVRRELMDSQELYSFMSMGERVYGLK